MTMMPTTRCAIASSMAMMAGRLKSNNTVASSRQQTFTWTEKFTPLISWISKQLTMDHHQSRPLVFCTSLLLIRTIIILFYQHPYLSILVKVNSCFILRFLNRYHEIIFALFFVGVLLYCSVKPQAVETLKTKLLILGI